MAKIEVYTWSNCPFCIRAKDLLTRKGANFEEIDLDDKDAELATLRARTGMRTIPQIFINDNFIGGFQDLAALDQNGELDKLLA